MFRYHKSAWRTELAGAFARNLALNVSSKVLALASSVLLARWLGPSGYGMYASSIAATLMLAVLAQLGLPTLVTRYIPVYEVRSQWGLMQGLLRRAGIFILSCSLLLSCLGIFVAWVLKGHLRNFHVTALWWAMAILPIASLNALRSAVLQGFRYVIAAQVADSLLLPASFITMIIAWKLVGAEGGAAEFSPVVAVALRLVATGVACILGFRLLVKRLPTDLIDTRAEYDDVTWLRSAAPVLLLGAGTIINAQTDVLMLAAMKGTGSAGIYQAAARGSELVAFSLFVVNTVVQPAISRLHALGEFAQLQKVVTSAARMALFIALPVAIILSIAAGPILNTIYGAEFGSGRVCLMILCVAQIINVGAGLVGNILTMTGHMKDAAMGVTIGAFVNIVLNIALIPILDIEGAALATGVSLIVWNIFLVARVRRRLGLSSGIFTSRP